MLLCNTTFSAAFVFLVRACKAQLVLKATGKRWRSKQSSLSHCHVEVIRNACSWYVQKKRRNYLKSNISIFYFLPLSPPFFLSTLTWIWQTAGWVNYFIYVDICKWWKEIGVLTCFDLIVPAASCKNMLFYSKKYVNKQVLKNGTNIRWKYDHFLRNNSTSSLSFHFGWVFFFLHLKSNFHSPSSDLAVWKEDRSLHTCGK